MPAMECFCPKATYANSRQHYPKQIKNNSRISALNFDECMGDVVKKKVFRGVGVGLFLIMSLSACGEFEGVDYLTMGHPADPGAQSGKKPYMSRALSPENIDVRPDLSAIGSSRSSSPAAMDHSKMGHAQKPTSQKSPSQKPSMNHRGSH